MLGRSCLARRLLIAATSNLRTSSNEKSGIFSLPDEPEDPSPVGILSSTNPAPCYAYAIADRPSIELAA